MRKIILLLWILLPCILLSQPINGLTIAHEQLENGHYLSARLTLDTLLVDKMDVQILNYQLLSAKINYHLGEFEFADRQIDTILQQISPSDSNYWDALLTKAEIHTAVGSFVIADSLLRQVEQLRGYPQMWQIRIGNDRAQWALWKQDFPLAEHLLTTHLADQDSMHIPQPDSYLRTLYHLVDVHLWQGQFEKSRSYFMQGLQFAEAENLLQHNYYAQLCELGGYLFFELENYQRALDYQLTTQSIFIRDYGKTHPRCKANESSIGTTYYFLEDFPNAEKYLLPSIELSAEEIVELDTLYSQRLFNIAGMYAEGGDDQRAYELAQRAEQIWLENKGSSGAYFGVLYAYLGEIAERLNDDTAAEKYLTTSIAMLTEQKEWMRLIHAHNQRAKLKLKNKETKLAQEILRKAISTEKRLKRPSISLVETHQLLGSIAMQETNYTAALNHFYTAKHIQTQTSGTRSIAYAELESQCAQVLAVSSHHPLMAHKNFSRANALLLEQIEYIFPTLDENTRIQFLEKVNKIVYPFMDFVMQNQQQQPDLITELLDLKLTIDGIGLENSRNVLFANPQRQFNDTLYHHWSQQRKELRKAYNLSSKERKAAGIDLAEFQYAVQLTEKKLGWKNTTAIEQNLNYTNMKVRLDKREAAIDFFQYTIRDTVFYAALVIRPEQLPQLILLTTDAALRPLLDRQFTPAGSHYINNTAQQTELYELIWQPLIPYINNVRKVMIIPTGWLHRVSFATLSSAKESLLEQYEIVYHSALRGIYVSQATKLKTKTPRIALFGGAIYDAKLTEEVGEPALLTKETTYSSTLAQLSRSLRGDSLRNAISFTYLPATKTEVEQIEQLAQPQKWTTHTYLGKAATEENIKNNTGQNAPHVLHLATHGFFFPALDIGDVATKNLRENLLLVKNPLLRSGLALTGANETWLNGNSSSNREDGILTAYEIYDLDLQNTELVVLSACETARGDAVAGEGVFGLQRAFKIAGVEQLLLSLWQVPDESTAQLMQIFYQYYFKGNTATVALRKAQLNLQKTHSNYDWGAFILLK